MSEIASPWLTLVEAATYSKRGKRFVAREVHLGRLRCARGWPRGIDVSLCVAGRVARITRNACLGDAPKGLAEPEAQDIQRTIPATPSTATCAQSGMRRVASATSSTMGMPRSRPRFSRAAVCSVSERRTAGSVTRTDCARTTATHVTISVTPQSNCPSPIPYC